MQNKKTCIIIEDEEVVANLYIKRLKEIFIVFHVIDFDEYKKINVKPDIILLDAILNRSTHDSSKILNEVHPKCYKICLSNLDRAEVHKYFNVYQFDEILQKLDYSPSKLLNHLRPFSLI